MMKIEIADHSFVCAMTGNWVSSGNPVIITGDGDQVCAQQVEDLIDAGVKHYHDTGQGPLLDDRMDQVDLDSLIQTSVACPTSWDGETTSGKRVYIRFRHGYLRVDYNDEVVQGDYHAGDGVLSWGDMVKQLKEWGLA